MKACPFCAEEIQDDAIYCRFCNSFLDNREAGVEPTLAIASGPAAVNATVIVDRESAPSVSSLEGSGMDASGPAFPSSPAHASAQPPRTVIVREPVWHANPEGDGDRNPIGGLLALVGAGLLLWPALKPYDYWGLFKLGPVGTAGTAVLMSLVAISARRRVRAFAGGIAAGIGIPVLLQTITVLSFGANEVGNSGELTVSLIGGLLLLLGGALSLAL